MKIITYNFVNHCRINFVHSQNILRRTKAILWMDERVKVMNEVIAGMRVIKMYTWEDSFSKWIRQIRRYEFLL